MRAYWTPGEDEALRKMAKAGRTVLEMTKVLKSRTISAIEGRAKILELSVSRAKKPEIDHQLLREMLKAKEI